jgi:RNA polymerase sigma-70 factor, ECF subfamily
MVLTPDLKNGKLTPENWVDDYGDYLYHFALSRTRDPAVSEDLVQETFLAALKAKGKFESRSKEKTWLTGILKHKVADHYRKKSRDRVYDNFESFETTIEGLFDENGHWKEKPTAWPANPQELYEQKAFLAVLFGCLSGISERLATAFTLREMNGSSTEEICKLLDITTTNCWVMLHRARSLVRLCLEKNWFQSIRSENEK